MGGAVALKSHLKEPSMWDGAVLVAPMCKIAEAMYPPWYMVRIMIALAYVIPKAKLVPHTDIAEIGFRCLEKRKRVSLLIYLPQILDFLLSLLEHFVTTYVVFFVSAGIMYMF